MSRAPPRHPDQSHGGRQARAVALSPDVVKAIFRQLHESKRAAGLPDGGELDPYQFGVEACRPILEIIIDFCHQQKLIPCRMSVDELFDDTTRILGTPEGKSVMMIMDARDICPHC